MHCQYWKLPFAATAVAGVLVLAIGCQPWPERGDDQADAADPSADAGTDGGGDAADADGTDGGSSADDSGGEANATVVRLEDPDSVAVGTLSLSAGQAIELQWDAASVPEGAELMYVNLDTGEETVVAATISDGSASWTVPATLAEETDYEFRMVDPADGTALLASQVFSLAPANTPDADTGTDGPLTGDECTTDADCGDGIYCNGEEQCDDGFCVGGTSPCEANLVCNPQTGLCSAPDCAVDADCGEDMICQDQFCAVAPIDPATIPIPAIDPATGEQMDLDEELPLGTEIRFEAPDPTQVLLRRAADTCTCAWSVDPATAGTFDDAASCVATFTLAESGTAKVSVDVTCEETETTFSQTVLGEEPFVCEENFECADGEVCDNGDCVTAPPPTPTVTILDQSVRIPYLVRFDLRILDAEGEVIPAGIDVGDFTVYEDDVELDLSETSLFVTPGENLPLRVLLVLDYSASMAAANAIEPMIEAAAGFVQAAHFTASHSIGVVEFHERTDEGEGYSLAVPLTAAGLGGKAEVVSGLPAADSVEPGLSRVWDAVDLAIRTFEEIERQPGEVRAIVFLTDGRDTTSLTDAISLTSAAQAGEIALYPIGFGDVAENEPTLQQMAAETGGAYFSSSSAGGLSAAFAQVAFDLRGQWNLTYITPRNSGIVDVSVEFSWEGATTSFEAGFDAGAIAGDVHQGVIAVLDREYDEEADRTSFLMRAAYLPRRVDRLRFQFAHSGTTFALQERGGLLDLYPDWIAAAADDDAYWMLGPAFPAGSFGNLGVASVPGEVEHLQVTHDDTIFAGYVQPKTIAFEGESRAPPCTLTVNVEPEGAGTVAVDPDKPYYGIGEEVELTATSATHVFDHWVGATGDAATSMTISGDASVTAVFVDP